MSPSHIADRARRAWHLQNQGKHNKAAAAMGCLSTGERCAVALLINRLDMLPGGYSVVDAIERMESGGWPVSWLIEAQKILRDEE